MARTSMQSLTLALVFAVFWSPAAWSLSEKKEVELGKTLHPRVIQDFGISEH